MIDASGKERRFNGLKLEWGFDQFIPLIAFNDASNGYLVEDTCVFGAEVFVKERNMVKGECLSMEKYAYSSKYVWKVENFSKLDKGRQESQVFCAGNQKWYQRFNFFFLNQIIDVNTFLNLEARFSVNLQLSSI